MVRRRVVRRRGLAQGRPPAVLVGDKVVDLAAARVAEEVLEADKEEEVLVEGRVAKEAEVAVDLAVDREEEVLVVAKEVEAKDAADREVLARAVAKDAAGRAEVLVPAVVAGDLEVAEDPVDSDKVVVVPGAVMGREVAVVVDLGRAAVVAS